MAKTQKNKKVANFQPKLKQKQKILHRLKALFRIINLVLFSAFLYGYYIFWDLPFWKVQDVEMTGLSSIGYQYIKKIDPEKSYKGHHILNLDSSLITKKLDNFRLFEKVSVNRKLFPTKIYINFYERVPYITIYDSSQEKDITIDEEGIVLTYLKPNKNKSIYSVNNVKDYKLKEGQINAIRVIENLRNTKKIKDIGFFDISNPNNLILKTDENKVLLGNNEDLVMKINSIKALESLSKTTKNELEYIDVRYWRNPVLIKKGSD